MYDTRHTAITRLAETGTPFTVIMDMAGHVSPKMTMHYTQVSEQAKIIAIEQAQNIRRGYQPEYVPTPIRPASLPPYGDQAEMRAEYHDWKGIRAPAPPAPPAVTATQLPAPVVPISAGKPASPFSTFTTTIGHTFQRW